MIPRRARNLVRMSFKGPMMMRKAVLTACVALAVMAAGLPSARAQTPDFGTEWRALMQLQMQMRQEIWMLRELVGSLQAIRDDLKGRSLVKTADIEGVLAARSGVCVDPRLEVWCRVFTDRFTAP